MFIICARSDARTWISKLHTDEGCVVFIYGDKGAIESRHQPRVNVFKNSQKLISTLELEYFKNFRKKCEVFQIETPFSSNESSEEVSLEVILHLIVFKDIWDTLVSFLRHYDMQLLRLERKGMCMGREVKRE